MLSRIVTALAATLMAASPCAAQIPGPEERGVSRRGAAVGAYFRIPFEGRGERRSRPQLGLRVTAVQSEGDYRASRAPTRETDALDLRLTGFAQPTLLLAGRPVGADQPGRLNALSTTETIALGAGALMILVVLAVAATSPGFPDCPAVGGNRDHCI
jgi:hypothetical protein